MEYEGADQNDSQGYYDQPGDRTEIAIADPGERQIVVDECRPPGEQIRGPAKGRVSAERDNKGRQPEVMNNGSLSLPRLSLRSKAQPE